MIDNSAARVVYNAKKNIQRIQQLPIKQREREKYRYVTLSSASHLMRSHPIQGSEFACQDERLSPHASLTASKESPAENKRSYREGEETFSQGRWGENLPHS